MQQQADNDPDIRNLQHHHVFSGKAADIIDLNGDRRLKRFKMKILGFDYLNLRRGDADPLVQ